MLPTNCLVRCCGCRFANNCVLVQCGMKAYCGAPLIASNGHRLGSLYALPPPSTAQECR